MSHQSDPEFGRIPRFYCRSVLVLKSIGTYLPVKFWKRRKGMILKRSPSRRFCPSFQQRFVCWGNHVFVFGPEHSRKYYCYMLHWPEVQDAPERKTRRNAIELDRLIEFGGAFSNLRGGRPGSLS